MKPTVPEPMAPSATAAEFCFSGEFVRRQSFAARISFCSEEVACEFEFMNFLSKLVSGARTTFSSSAGVPSVKIGLYSGAAEGAAVAALGGTCVLFSTGWEKKLLCY